MKIVECQLRKIEIEREAGDCCTKAFRNGSEAWVMKINYSAVFLLFAAVISTANFLIAREGIFSIF